MFRTRSTAAAIGISLSIVLGAMLALVVSAQVIEFGRKHAAFEPAPDLPRPKPSATNEIHGFIFVPVAGKDRFVPDVTVFSRDYSGAESPRVQTDCRGRFVIPPMPSGSYRICWEAAGYVNDCSSGVVPLSTKTAYPDPFGMQPEFSVAYGTVTLADGSAAAYFDPDLGVNERARVTLLDAATAEPLQAVNVGCGNGYVMAGIAPGNYDLQAEYAGETRVAPLFPGNEDSVDLLLANSPPRIRLAYVSLGGAAVRRAAPGTAVELHVVTDDVDDDPISFTFEPAEGSIVEEPDATRWILGQKERQELSIVATDHRGGYARYRLTVPTSVEVPFSGLVLDPQGQPIVDASVTVNGETAATDPSGWFSLQLPQAGPRYMMTIQAGGYMLFSRIFPEARPGRNYTLTPAERVVIDPAQPVSIRPQPGVRSAGLEIPPGALVDGAGQPASGPLNVYIGTVDLGDPNGGMPGDQIGMDAVGAPVGLVSFGAISISIEDNSGNEYNLQQGASATVTIPIPPTKTKGNVPPSIPLWIYNESSGVWEGVGQAQRQGDNYVGNVPHFSEINADIELTNPVCIQLVADTSFAGYAPDPLTFPFDIRIEVPSTGDVFVKEIDQAVNSLYALPASTNVELVILDSNGDPIEATRQTVTTGSYNPSCPLDPPYPYGCCTATATLKPDIPAAGTFLDFIGVSDNEEALWYTSVIDPLPTAGAGTISASGTTLTGVGTFFTSLFVPGDLVRPTPTVGPGTIGTTGTTEVTGTGTSFTTDFDPGDIIDVGGKTRLIVSVPSNTQLFTLSPFSPAITAGTSYSHAEVRLVQTIAGDTSLTLDQSFNHAPSAATYDKIGERPNLTAWELANTFNPPDESAVYYNGADLGFGRWMQSKQVGSDSFYAVANFGTPGVFDPGAVELARLAAANVTDVRFATVVMEYSDPHYAGTPYTKFFVYDGNGKRVLNADLDGLGSKGLPRLCMMCHAGQMNSADSRGDVGSRFLPFDLPAYHYSGQPGFTRVAQEPDFKALNAGVLGTAPSPATDEMIKGSYGGTTLPSPTFNDNWVPVPDWSANVDLYNFVVKKSCRGCHITQNTPIDWADYALFDAYGSFIQSLACDTKAMPNARLTYAGMWLSTNPHQPNELENAGLTGWNTSLQCD